MMRTKDKLESMFELREEFMKCLDKSKPGSYPEWPVNLSSKQSQQIVRDLALKGVEEMFEALGHLKNWKPHRDTEVRDIDHDKFLEEIVDAFNYFLSMIVLVGVKPDDFFQAFLLKDKKIHERIKSGY